jgi:hypothetical protein
MAKKHLTSTTMPYSAEGNYNPIEVGSLFSHEAIRREFARGSKALNHIDPVKDTWKIVCFIEWYQKFLFPIAHDHENGEENVVGPIFLEAGAAFPETLLSDHPALRKRLNDINQNCQDLLQQIKKDSAVTVFTAETFKPLFLTLKSTFMNLRAELLVHLALEESIFPGISVNVFTNTPGIFYTEIVLIVGYLILISFSFSFVL